MTKPGLPGFMSLVDLPDLMWTTTGECRAGKAPGPVSRGLLMRSAVHIPLYPLYPIWGSNKMLSDWRTRQIEPACSIALFQSQWKALLLVNWKSIDEPNYQRACSIFCLYTYILTINRSVRLANKLTATTPTQHLTPSLTSRPRLLPPRLPIL